jgi:glycosyltransferase involved in cell wall biosynthesis
MAGLRADPLARDDAVLPPRSRAATVGGLGLMLQNRPAATLLAPLLNQEERYLIHSLDSAVRQTADCEILIVLSPKTGAANRKIVDGIAERDPRVRVVQQVRPGFPAALNEGIEQARSDRLGILLTDDWLEPTAIADSLTLDADITSTQMLTFAADGATPVHRPWKAISQAVYDGKDDLEQKACYLQHFFLLRKQKVIEAGGLDESLGDTPGIDDFDLIWSMLEHNASAAIVEKPLYNYRDHSGLRLTLHDRENMVRTMAQILKKHGLRGARFEAALERHSIWFGRTMQEVIRERSGGAKALPDMHGLLPGDHAAAING